MSEPRPQTEPELIEFVRSIDAAAPDQLHERIRALTEQAPARGGARSRPLPGKLGWRFGSALAVAAVVVLALVAVSLTGGGGDSGLGLREASALTLRAATMAAPSENTSRRAQLDESIDGISFPYWSERFGWRATGARLDELDGRTVRTVFYQNGRGRRIGYAIVGGSPPPKIDTGLSHWREGTSYKLSAEHGAKVLTWLRDGHLCIVSGRGVSAATLLALASWDDHDTIS